MNKDNLKYNSADIKKYRQQIIKEINADAGLMEELKSRNVSPLLIEANASFIYEYLEAKRSVALCQSVGKCLQENHYHALNLVVNGKFITTEIAVCPLYVKEQALLSRFVVKDVPFTALKQSFKDLVERSSFNAFRSEMLRLIKGERESVFVTSPHNIGVLEESAIFLMQALIDHESVHVGVLNLPRFVAEFSSDIYNNKSEIENRLNFLSTIDYLVIDELGNEETNNLIRDTILFPLINNRVKSNKKTVFLSELTLSELRMLYMPNSQSIRGQQIINLIKNSIKREITVSGTSL